ncbi:MAG TPA: DUF3800 domain-containing protein [Deltaproteobacteria bacterium]|nr:DUF3800 domain-containing protein [Deltaproteobacteria bacterium]
MFLAYLDESGDSGISNSPTRFFVLACVLVHDQNWLNTLNSLIDLRRTLKRNYGIPIRQELKGKHFKNGHGAFESLSISLNRRLKIYEEVLEFQSQCLDIKTFAIAIEKGMAYQRGWSDPRLAAWTFALQRINRFCQDYREKALIFPDEGHGFFIRTRLRHMRRYHKIPSYFGTEAIDFPTDFIVEDPNERVSHRSFFVQLADWNAYAAHRSRYVDPKGMIDDLWDELKSVRLYEVNALRGGPPGIVKYP